MIDFKKITAETPLYNFHGHTQFCDGHSKMEDFVKEAVSMNFLHYGFSPHAPIMVESPCNMSRVAVPDYFDEINRLRKEYGDKINIYSSMEIDYIDDFGPSSPYFQSMPLDYRIGSVHFIPAFDMPGTYVDIDGSVDAFKIKMAKYFNHDIEAVVRSFYKQSFDMIESGGFDIIGHFDKIGYNAGMYCEGIDEAPWYDELVFDLFQAIMDHHLIVEINTKAWIKNNRFFPHLKYFGMLKKYKAPVVFNSDAHNPALINAGRFEAMKHYDML